MPPGSQAFGQSAKHQNHLLLLERMMSDHLPDRMAQTPTMQEGFEKLRAYPTIGDFLAYQFVTDINYSEITDFSEMDFVVPGPGARDGLRKCFIDPGGLNEPELIRLMADLQEREFERLGPRLSIAMGPPAPVDRLPELVLRGRQVRARGAPARRWPNWPHAHQTEVRTDVGDDRSVLSTQMEAQRSDPRRRTEARSKAMKGARNGPR